MMLLCWCFVSCGMTAAAMAGPTTMFDVRGAIQKIKEEQSATVRTKYAEQLADSIRREDPVSISEADIDALAALMSDRDDSVRYWIATSIGYIGPGASRAIPQLERALRERACDTHASKTSASAIRLAYSRIGVKPPELPCK
jgi:hypothetical protein